MSKKQKPTPKPKEQRPQIDREIAVRTIQNFCHSLRNTHEHMSGIYNAINTMANEITKLDGGLFTYKNFLKDELVSLENIISELEGAYQDE